MSSLSRTFFALFFASSLVAQLPTKEPPPQAPPRAKPQKPEPEPTPDQSNGNVTAYVSLEGGKPFGGAVVILEQDGKEIRAGAKGENGFVTFVWVKPGVYKAIFRSQGYQEVSLPSVRVGGGKNIEIKAVMKKKP